MLENVIYKYSVRIGEAKAELLSGRFFFKIVNKKLQNVTSFIWKMEKTKASQTNFGVTNWGSNMHCISAIAI